MNARRQIRVFVSSTFRDMQPERHHLVKFVFPQLRKLSESRGVTWGEVDLRWGISDDQEDKVLELCLEEIQRCRPYFIGLLGERYGWVPEKIPPSLLAQQGWLQIHAGRSVTELEIIHGVLRDQEMHGHAFFYFRDRGWLDRLPPGSRRSDFESESPEANARLGRLKQQIRNARDEMVCELREDYRDPRELGQWILEDFTRLIDGLWPASRRRDPLDREADDQEAFAESRARVYIGRPAYFEQLDAFAMGGQPPLVVVGESGSGKSALLANWALRHRTANPGDFVLTHFIGATPHSSDWTALLRRIVAELKRHFGIAREIPGRPDALRAAFGNWLHLAGAQGRVILVLDALDQLEDRNGAPDLVWLPPTIPANVRLVLSSLPGRPLDEVRKRGWGTLLVEPLDPGERAELIRAYLLQYGKTLGQGRVARLVAGPSCASPLFLRVLLDELRQFGEHERLDECIAHYLEAGTTVELFQRVLARWEQDYDGAPGLVQNALTSLWGSRRGLSEAELLDLLGTDDGPLPRSSWAPLFLAAETALVNRSGLLGFFHDHLRRAVRQRYLSDEYDRRRTHLGLADYFAARDGLPQRTLDELPWQLSEAEDWPRLAGLLAEPGFLVAAWDRSEFDVKICWARIEAASAFRRLEAYRRQIERPDSERDMGFLEVVARLLLDSGHGGESLRLYATLVRHFTESREPASLQACLGGTGLAQLARGDLAGASESFRQQELICRDTGDPAGLARSLAGRALVLQQQGELPSALALHQEQELIARKLGNLLGLATALHDQAIVEQEIGRFDQALEHYREEERISRQLEDLDGLQHSLGGQAAVLGEQHHMASVFPLYQEQERLCRQLGDRHALAGCLGNQALALKKLGNLNGAMAKHREEEQLFRELASPKGLAISLGNQALIQRMQGDPASAMSRLREQEQICRDHDFWSTLAICLGNQAGILADRGEYESAMKLCLEKERICRRLDHLPQLAVCLGDQAVIFRRQGLLDQMAMRLREQEQILRQLNDLPRLVGNLGQQALYSGKPAAEAAGLLQEAERICRQSGDRANLPRLLGSRALVAERAGDVRTALALLQEAEAILRQASDWRGAAGCINRRAQLLADIGRESEASVLRSEAEQIRERLDGTSGGG